MDFHLQSRRLMLDGWEKILQGECCWLVPDLILSIVYGHVLFLFLIVLFFRLVFIKKKKNPKTLRNFKKTKIFYFMSCFICFEDYMNYDISLDLEHAWHCGETWKLFLILCEYVLICTCTHGVIKKLIFLICVPSIA